jgi:hypothetical protein
MHHAFGAGIRDIIAFVLPRKEQYQRERNKHADADQNTGQKFILFHKTPPSMNSLYKVKDEIASKDFTAFKPHGLSPNQRVSIHQFTAA